MSDVVRWALLGAGRHPELRIAPAVNAAKNAVLRGVWSQDPARGAAFAERHGAERAYKSLAEALGDRDVDAVFISTPNALHAEHAIAAARAGKHLIVEKPMAVSADEARAIVRAARENGRHLGVGYHMRHHSVLREAARIVAAGEIGDVVYATAAFVLHSFVPSTIPNSPWKSDARMMGGGGSLMGMGVHVMDTLRFLIGREVTKVTALSDGQNAERPLDRLSQICLEFEGGAQAHMMCSGRFPFSRNDAVIYGSRGRVVAYDSVDMNAGHGHLEVTTPNEHGGTSTRTVRAAVPDHFVAEVEAFGAAVAGGPQFRADGIDGLRAVEITSAAIASLWDGRRVAVERGDP